MMNVKIGRRTVLLLAIILGALTLSSGVALAATISCQAGVVCFGTKKADTLNGTAGLDDIHGRGGGDTLKGLGEVDYLFGQGGKDRLLGGSAYDYLSGGAGNDTLSGGGGNDEYYFGDGWGKDSITDVATPNTKLKFHELQQEARVTDDLIIDLVSGTGPEAKDKSGTNTINWDGNVIDTVHSGDGDDRITGNASANLILGNSGTDTIFGGKGDDRIYGENGDDKIYVNDGSSGDIVHCGAGEDTVKYDEIGLLSDTIDSDCEHLYAV